MNRFASVAAALLLASALPPVLAARQAAPAASASEALRVFLDCNTFCDFDYLRREITYVNWVRDRQDADVHLILTSQGTGGGGREYLFRFLGLGVFKDSNDEINFTTQQSDTDDEVRARQTQRIGLGLARYLARGVLADRLRLTYSPPADGAGTASTQQPQDPWNLWVFTIGANGNVFSESRYSESFLSGSLRARRVTEKWKLSTSLRGSRSHSRYDLDSNEVVRSTTSDYTFNSVAVKSLGAHWSIGLNGGVRHSSVNNYDLFARLAPGIEYDVFPYAESSRRQLLFVYELGMSYANYTEETIFSKFRETRPIQALTVAVEAVQPWGNVAARLAGSNYLDNWSQNRVSLTGGFEIRIVRGLNLNLQGSYTRLRDQLSLAKAGASDVDVLKQLKQLKTSYRLFAFVGLNYTFGSKFNNVVNPRFGSSVFDF